MIIITRGSDLSVSSMIGLTAMMVASRSPLPAMPPLLALLAGSCWGSARQPGTARLSHLVASRRSSSRLVRSASIAADFPLQRQ